MELYTPTLTPNIIRVKIRRHGEKSVYFSVYKTTLEDAVSFFKKVIENQKLTLSPFEKSLKKTGIDLREATGRAQGKCKTISFIGLTVDETEKILLNSLKTI